jgi:hypothetical protein
MTNSNDVIEIKDAFSPTLFAYVKNTIMNGGCPWAYLDGAAYGYGIAKQKTHQSSFSSLIFMDQIRHNPISGLLEAGLMVMLDKIQIPIINLSRIRIGMMIQSDKNHINDAHVDSDSPHMTAILYLTSCDAPTILYDEFYDPLEKLDPQTFISQKKLNVYKKIPCVENTAVIFNGFRYHSSSIQTDVARRIAVNFNFSIHK